MNEDWDSLQTSLGYRFRDPRLLVTALTHSSYGGEQGVADNERLEFLGDAVLDAAVAELLMEHENMSEGDLSRWRAALVCEESLAGHASRFDLGGHLRLGKGEEHSGGRSKSRLLASAYEALLGAMFQDSGYESTRAWIARQFAAELEEPAAAGASDFKTELQERTQKQDGVLPQYKVVAVDGPQHRPRYRVNVEVNGAPLATGEGTTRKAAEQEAAEKALRSLGRDSASEPSP